MHCRAWRVRGRVQGVAFRAGARQAAIELGLNGYAQNLPDGRVEVAACGDEAALEALADWLWQGPPPARVEAVEEVGAPAPLAGGFFTC